MDGLELKYAGGQPVLTEGRVVEGYASLFDVPDQGNDVVARGAYAAGLDRLAARGDRVRMLWQHDATRPIGVWDEIHEDARGLFVRGRLLPEVALAAEAAALLKAGAIDGLSIGYRTRQATRDAQGRRILLAVDLWEVSLVTFPMLPEARIDAAACIAADARRAGDMAQKDVSEATDMAWMFKAATTLLRV